MPKPVKKRARARDVNEIAFDLARQTAALTEEPASKPPSFKAQLSAYMSKLGAKGGKASGAKRMEMPEEQRREIALRAARARWAAKKKR